MECYFRTLIFLPQTRSTPTFQLTSLLPFSSSRDLIQDDKFEELADIERVYFGFKLAFLVGAISIRTRL